MSKIAFQPKTMTDHHGRGLHIGDEVAVLYIDRGRGAEMWMRNGIVKGFGRTRVKVCFPSRANADGWYAIGPECLALRSPGRETPAYHQGGLAYETAQGA